MTSWTCWIVAGGGVAAAEELELADELEELEELEELDELEEALLAARVTDWDISGEKPAEEQAPSTDWVMLSEPMSASPRPSATRSSVGFSLYARASSCDPKIFSRMSSSVFSIGCVLRLLVGYDDQRTDRAVFANRGKPQFPLVPMGDCSSARRET